MQKQTNDEQIISEATMYVDDLIQDAKNFVNMLEARKTDKLTTNLQTMFR